ncbi:MAG: hypothetical protein ACYSTL_01975, partial [Planctomycetota bacterium]
TGIELLEWITPRDVLPMVLGAVRIFEAHGDRENRRKARFRHIRQCLGDKAFKTLLLGAFEVAKTTKT